MQAAEEAGVNIETVELDVSDTESVTTAVEKIGHVDILVNNAGIGGATPLELVPLEEHQQMFDTNYFGAVRCIHAVLPQMRERGSGSIVNITSVLGLMAMPNQIPYSASKWALECLGEALAHELHSFGIRVVNIEPGVVLTNIFENSAEQTRYDKTSPYRQVMRRNSKFFTSGQRLGTPAESVTEAVIESIETEDYRLRWPVGQDAQGVNEGRATHPADEWVAMGGDLTDEHFNARYHALFGIELS